MRQKSFFRDFFKILVDFHDLQDKCSRTGTAELGDWLEVGLGFVSKLPRYLVPRYFHSVISRFET